MEIIMNQVNVLFLSSLLILPIISTIILLKESKVEDLGFSEEVALYLEKEECDNLNIQQMIDWANVREIKNITMDIFNKYIDEVLK